MKNKPFEAEMDNKSFISFFDGLNSGLPEPISRGDDVFMTEDKNSPLALSQNGEPNLTKLSNTEDDSSQSEDKDDLLGSFLKKDQVKPREPKKEDPPTHNQDPFFMDSFLIELVHKIKNALGSIYHATVLTMDKYDDVEIRRRSHTQVKEDIKRIDSVLNSLLNFININTPIIKTNTLCTILEEILEANEKQLQQKNISIIKKYEENLPDTFINPEQVRFILHSILQYAILSTPSNETIGFLMKSRDFHDGTVSNKVSPENNRRYSEVVIGFNEDRKPVNILENSSEALGNQKEGVANLILKLAKETLQRNHGIIIETSGKRLKTLIHLRFPVERRKVVYYEPIAI
jgi:nitrogen-specific signal transduction histidine kinase